MAKFLNTSATNYYLEELIKNAKERIVLISPFLKFNDRIKELLEDKNRMKIDIRLVYGKTELQPEEMNWLSELMFVRTSFCKNLHAKCYMNEDSCIITSLNLYDFSQVNNNEMGIFLTKEDDGEVYSEAYDEAQRIIRVSDEVRVLAQKIERDSTINSKSSKPKSKYTAPKEKPSVPPTPTANSNEDKKYKLLTTYKFAALNNLTTKQVNEKLLELGYLTGTDGKYFLTGKADEIGAVRRTGKSGAYFLWPTDLKII